MTAQDGVKSVLVSGMRSTVVMKEGKSLSEEKLTDAMGAKKLKLVSVKVVEQPVATIVYNMKVKGAT